jgi:hypothetical protein
MGAPTPLRGETLAGIRMMIVGQGPSEHGDPDRPLEGAADKLGPLMGLTPALFVDRYARINLNAQWIGKAGKGDVFDISEGYVAAKVLLRGSWTHYVLLGQKVAQCFGIKSDPCTAVEAIGKHFLLIPHPSGINQWWNKPYNRSRAAAKLKEFLL